MQGPELLATVLLVECFLLPCFGCDVSTSKVRKRIMTPLPRQVSLSHTSLLRAPDTVASLWCECSFPVQRSFPFHHLFMLQTFKAISFCTLPTRALSVTTVIQIKITPGIYWVCIVCQALCRILPMSCYLFSTTMWSSYWHFTNGNWGREVK